MLLAIFILCPTDLFSKADMDSLEIKTEEYMDSLVLAKLFSYHSTIDTSSIEGYQTEAYIKYQIKTDRRNPILLCVPHLYSIARSHNRSYIGEQIASLTFHNNRKTDFVVKAHTNTIRHHRTVMPNLSIYLIPNIYNTTMITDRILSPFHVRNKRFYKYAVAHVFNGRAQLEFRPKARNTQTTHGHAMVDIETGRIISCNLSGEYDMVNFEINLVMGKEGFGSLLPQTCTMKMKFSFLGNKLRGIYHAVFGIPSSPSSETPTGGREEIEQKRPEPLNKEEMSMYSEFDSLRVRHRPDTTIVPEKNFIKNFLWDEIGRRMIQRTKGRFGMSDKGYYRMSPILNPLYVGYSHRRGVTYKFSLNGGYLFDNDHEIRGRMKIGYSFKLKLINTDIPLTYTFNNRHNGFLHIRWRSGQRITNSTIKDMVILEAADTTGIDQLELEKFNHSSGIAVLHYDLNRTLGIEVGGIFNQWKAVRPDGFYQYDRPVNYYATSLTAELTVRPTGYRGPIFTINYERTLKSMSRNRMNFEKIEADCSYLHLMPCMRSFSIRGGFGFYTSDTKKTYFLEYNNFRDVNIPGGWNDDWSGRFELLPGKWYNSSKYYVRAHATYESPMLALSWIPLLGRVIEKERFYLSGISLKGLSNYVEVGYGMTNRFFSMGLFTSFRKGHYENIGCKFGFELFEGW